MSLTGVRPIFQIASASSSSSSTMPSSSYRSVKTTANHVLGRHSTCHEFDANSVSVCALAPKCSLSAEGGDKQKEKGRRASV